MDVSVEGHEIRVSRSVPTLETSLSGRIEAKYSLEQCSLGKRLKIIELRQYNEVRELHIENRTAGSWAQVSYQGVIQKASVTKAAVRMGVTEMGMRTENRATYK